MHVLDYLFGLAARGPRFFQDGWGDRLLCVEIDPVALASRAPAKLDVRLARPRRALGGRLAEGSFESPEVRLPGCARTARVNLLLPDGPLRGVAVHLAASGDQGFSVRLRFAAPLLQHGIGALVLENAFYGARRPANQPRHAVRSISDLHLMGAATFQEGRALLRWLRDERQVPLVGITGYSMGGQLAAMVGASVPFPCAIVPVAAPCAPDSVLREGILHHLAEWSAIAAGSDPVAARRALCEHLARFSVEKLPPPLAPQAAIVVGAAQDGIVPPRESERIARHWGAELRWLPAGHVSAVLRYQGAMREAIAFAFEQLEAFLTRRSGRARRRPEGSARRARGAIPSAAVRARAPGRAPAPRT
jgi:hypothetical protein